jgi:hypothetical protein
VKREDIALAIGETKTISAVGIDQYTEGQSGIVSTQLTDDKTQFVIRAVKPGNTTLLLIRKDKSQVTYDISVAQRPPAVVEKELQQLLEGIPAFVSAASAVVSSSRVVSRAKPTRSASPRSPRFIRARSNRS